MKPTIQSVSYMALKGETGTVALAPLTAIIGANGKGKTAIMDAVLLGMTGFHPSLPKTNPGTMTLAGGPDMAVALKMDNGDAVTRKWSIDAKGSVKGTKQEPDGWDAEAAGLAFTPADFMRKNAKDRAKILMGTAVDTMTLPEIVTFRDTVETLCTGAARVTIKEIDPFAAANKVSALFLETVEAQAVDSRKALKQDKTRLETTIRGTEDSLRSAMAPLAVSGEDVEAAQAKLYELNATSTRMRERHLAAARQRDRLKGVDSASAWTAADATKLEEVLRDAKRIEGESLELKAFEERMASVINAAPEMEEVEEARATLAALAAIPVPSVKRPTATANLTTARSKVETIGRDEEHSAGESKRLEADLRDLVEHECCPTCGTKGAAMKEAAAQHFGALLDVQKARREELKTARTEAEAEVEKWQEIVTQWDHRDKEEPAREILKRDEATEAELDSLRSKEKPVVDTVQLAAMLEEADRLKVKKAAAEALKEIGEIVTDEDVEAARAALDNADTERDAYNVEFTALKGRRDAYVAHGAQELRMVEMRKELETVVDKLAKVESLVDEAVRCKGLLSAAIIKPMMETVSYFTHGILDGKLDADGEEIRYTDRKGSRPFQVLSGSERAVIAFAIGAALASKSPTGLVMLDEANVMDATRRPLFLHRIATAVNEGVLSQALVIDHTGSGFHASDGWKVTEI